MLTLLVPLALAGPFTPQGTVDYEGPLPPPEQPTAAPIIAGEAAARDEWPMAGGIIMETVLSVQGFELPQTATVCSSTLIAPDVVMLAAHCIDAQIYALQIQASGLPSDALGDLDFWFSRRVDLTDYQLGGNAQNLPADAVRAQVALMHPDFSAFALQPGLSENFDIALMFLEEPILDTPLGYLPQPDTDEVEMELDEEVVIVGWGKQVPTTGAQAPPAGTFGIKQQGISRITERRPFEMKIGESNTTRKCQGDSGGPTFKEVATDSAETWRVIGVTSHSYLNTDDCAITSGVDTRVSYYLDWIDDELRSRCDDGSRAWCDIPGIIPPPLADGTVAWEIPDETDGDGEKKKGCGCQTQATGLLGWMALMPLLLLRRR